MLFICLADAELLLTGADDPSFAGLVAESSLLPERGMELVIKTGDAVASGETSCPRAGQVELRRLSRLGFGTLDWPRGVGGLYPQAQRDLADLLRLLEPLQPA